MKFSYNSALNLLNSLRNNEKSNSVFWGLGNVKSVLADILPAYEKLPVITVGGTNGKGYTSFLLYSLFRNSGLKTGLYTSPHLFDIRERIVLNGKKIGKGKFAGYIGKIYAVSGRMGISLTYFEYLTITAVLYFYDNSVDIAVFEIGMGGRLDAVNILEPSVAVITAISKDHTGILGKRLKDIAVEKSYIMKSGAKTFSALQKKTVMEVLRSRANDINADISFVDAESGFENLRFYEGGFIFNWQGIKDIYFNCIAGFQLENLGLALEVFSYYMRKIKGGRISVSAVRKVLAKNFWPCRFNLINSGDFFILVDGAHNENAFKRLRESVMLRYEKYEKYFILAFSIGKDIRGMIGEVMKTCPRAVIVTCYSSGPRPMSVESVNFELKGKVETVSFEDSFKKAYNKISELIMKNSKRKSLLIIAGSLFIAAEGMKFLKGSDKLWRY